MLEVYAAEVVIWTHYMLKNKQWKIFLVVCKQILIRTHHVLKNYHRSVYTNCNQDTSTLQLTQKIDSIITTRVYPEFVTNMSYFATLYKSCLNILKHVTCFINLIIYFTKHQQHKIIIPIFIQIMLNPWNTKLMNIQTKTYQNCVNVTYQ